VKGNGLFHVTGKYKKLFERVTHFPLYSALKGIKFAKGE
jgi:hypothetical protein